MAETYFTKFPTIEYANVQIRDLSRHVVLGNNLRQIPTAFYPYDIENEQRSDVVSFAYYNDPDLDWLIYLTNGIVDPYYGWYLNDDEFYAFISKKYGGLEIAQQRIAYWTTNWTEDDINVTPGFYNSLPQLLKKYYSPVWGPRNAIIAYKRRAEDWIMNINQIIKVTLLEGIMDFARGDLVQSLDSDNAIIGTGEVLAIEDIVTREDGLITGSMIIGNIRNNWSSPLTQTLPKKISYDIGGNNFNGVAVDGIQKRNDDTTAHTVTAIVSIWVNITDNEAVYWTPIYYFDMEREINEQRKTIMLLDPGFVRDAARGVADLLKE